LNLSQEHILVLIVEDKPGVLNRVASLLRRRNFNIDSIAVGHSHQPHLSGMTIVVKGDNASIEQARKQLDKLIEVVKIVDITEDNPVRRELALVKVKATPATRNEIIQIADIFRANIVDVSTDSLMIEVTGDKEKVNSLMELLRGFGIKEIASTGSIALPRGNMGPLSINRAEEEKPAPRPKRSAAETKPDW
jgi:acetolactate synthase I/III small subunit